MSAYKGKTDRAEELEVIEALRKDGYSEAVIDHFHPGRADKEDDAEVVKGKRRA